MDELHREDGERVKPGTFHAVRLSNAGKVLTIRYEGKKAKRAGTIRMVRPLQPFCVHPKIYPCDE